VANERARELRNNATAAERKLWQRLRQLKAVGSKFRRQIPLDRFIVDFACLSKRVIIEVDGGTHGTDDELAYDQHRQRFLEASGFVVLRVTNCEVMLNIEGVMDTISNHLARHCVPTLSLSPQGGGE
jgi:very-short-patch-repair endonuclease